MIKAASINGKFELRADEQLITTLNTWSPSITDSFCLDGETFNIARIGFPALRTELRSCDVLVASAEKKLFFSRYTVEHAGRPWTLKSMNWSARKFGLFRDDAQVGNICSLHLNPYKGIVAEFPDDLPLKVQVYLMWMLIYKWTEDTGPS